MHKRQVLVLGLMTGLLALGHPPVSPATTRNHQIESDVVLYLVGAQLYSALRSGTTGDVHYQFSTNATPPAGHASLPLALEGDQSGVQRAGISFGLKVGDNVFRFQPTLHARRPFYGLNLFLNDTGASFNPRRCLERIAGDLTVAVAAHSSAFFVPAASLGVTSYTSNNVTVGACKFTAPTNGNASFAVGGYTVAVTALSETGASTGNPEPSGSFTLTVARRSPPSVTLLAVEVRPATARPGATIELVMHVQVGDSAPGNAVQIGQLWSLAYQGQAVLPEPIRSSGTWENGIHTSRLSFTVPADAAPGVYTFSGTIQSMAGSESKDALFTLQR